MTDEVWIVKKAKLDQFWSNILAYSGSGTLDYSRYRYWKGLSFGEDVLAGSLGVSLMSASASEACCERAFSILRKFISKQRRNLSVERLNDLITIRESTLPKFFFTSPL
jgi:hypothetical protein